ncbi:MAG: diguanylate cyclase [Deltaproteobacteria bacterium]|nr:diguanylate cyclase [Deltaproteobacteria bacterium]
MSFDEKKTILLVEDEPFLALPEKLTLREYGYQVITAFTGEKAIEAVGKYPQINLVLMNIHLGKGMDGIQAAKLILEKRLLPIIFLSPASDRRVVEKTEGLASYGCIIKGSEERGLIASIKMALRLFESQSKEKGKEEALRQSEEKYRTIFQAAGVGFWRVNNEGRLLEVNEAYGRMSGYSAQELLGLLVSDLEAGEPADGLAAQFQKVLGEGEDRFESKQVRKDGSIFDIEVTVQPDPSDGSQFLVFLRDISDHKKAEEALKTLSLRDELTGLYNRRGFFILAEQGLKTAQRMGKEMLLIFGDLDNMKGINDTFGHKEGDQALLDTSKILRETFRESDIIARIGGDEFVILAMKGPETSAEKLISRFKQVLNEHHRQTNRSYTLSLSLGIANFDPHNPCSIEVLLTQADQLMYEDKSKKNRQGQVS